MPLLCRFKTVPRGLGVGPIHTDVKHLTWRVDVRRGEVIDLLVCSI